jgi:hypothetical protein
MYATSWKVIVSIPGEVTEFFDSRNFFRRPVALGLTQPLTEVSIMKSPGDKEKPARKADNL